MAEIRYNENYTINDIIKEIENTISLKPSEKIEEEINEDIDCIKNNINNLIQSKKFIVDSTKLDIKTIIESIAKNKLKLKLKLPFEKCLFDISPTFIYATTEDCDDDEIRFISFVFEKSNKLQLQKFTEVALLNVNSYLISIIRSEGIFESDEDKKISDNIIKLIGEYLTHILINVQSVDEPIVAFF